MRASPALLILAACASAGSESPVLESPVVEQPRSVPTHALRPKLLRSFLPYVSYPPWSRLELVGDWDGDGVPDLALTSQERKRPEREPGLLILSSKDGRELAAFEEAPTIIRSAQMGSWDKGFTALGDIDADKRADIAMLSAGIGADGKCNAVLRAFGASKPEPIWSQAVDVPSGTMPFVVQRLGDLDGDAIADLGLGIPPWVDAPIHADSLSDVGWVEARSGKDGHVLWRVRGRPGLRTGWEIARYADRNGDGIEDVAVLATMRDPSDSSASSDDEPTQLEIRSGASGELLRITPELGGRLHVGSLQSIMPYHLCGGEDVDGDGVIDLALRTVRIGELDTVDVISGRSGTTIGRLTPFPDPNGREEAWFPSDIAIASDLDGDGWRDVLLGHDEVGTEMGADYGAIYVHSTRTNQRLVAVWGDEDDVKLGGAIAWLGDTDGDGAPEFAALTTRGVRIWAVEREAR